MSATPIDAALIRDLPLPALPVESDKEARGRVFVVAGGAAVPGAPILTGLAALRVGAGKLKLAAPRPAAVALGLAVPEAAVLSMDTDADGEIGEGALDALAQEARRADVVIVGPGLISASASRLGAVLTAASPGAGVIDAGALDGLLDQPELKAAAGRMVLTPHAGEMASLLGWSKAQVLAKPTAAAREAASRANAVVALKGRTTYIASPDGRLWRHDGGVQGLGTSGSGDVLAGFIGGFLARGASPLTAAVWGVLVHGLCGRQLSAEIGALGFLAREVVDQAPGVLEQLSKTGDRQL